MKRSLPVVLAAVAALASACSGGGGSLDTSRVEKTASGTYTVAYLPSPDPIPVNQPFSILVLVSSSGVAIVKNVGLSVDATMPDMNMGMPSPPTITQNSSGTFSSTGMYFSMGGHWVLDCGVTPPGGSPDHATFNIVAGSQ